MLLALGVITLASCDKDTEGLSRITTYAVLEMNGESFMKVNVGGSFNDPGCVATMGGEDVTDQIQVNSNVDTSKPGFYNVNYVVYNDDGFPASASRTVMVVDPNNFAGVYLGESEFGSRHYYNAPINITKRAATAAIPATSPPTTSTSKPFCSSMPTTPSRRWHRAAGIGAIRWRMFRAAMIPQRAPSSSSWTSVHPSM